MNSNQNSNNNQGQQHPVNPQRPDVRDNLDSRKKKEAGYKDNNNQEGKKPNTKDQNAAGN